MRSCSCFALRKKQVKREKTKICNYTVHRLDSTHSPVLWHAQLVCREAGGWLSRARGGPWDGETRNVPRQCPSSAASLRSSLGKEELEAAQKGRQTPCLMKEVLGGLSGPQRGGHVSPGAAMQAKAERGRRKWNKWHYTPTRDNSSGVQDIQTGRGAGLRICKIPSGMEQSCGLGRV